MFTGIVQAVGEVKKITPTGESKRITVYAGGMDLSDVALGDSIAVSGPCLTVVSFDRESFEVDVSIETLQRSTLSQKSIGDPVNLEKALCLSDRLGGHLVSGHVDGIGKVTTRKPKGDYISFEFEVKNGLERYLAPKGSVSIDGVSLTINETQDGRFEVLTIPHTLERTTLGKCTLNSEVNLEVDQVARYIEHLMSSREMEQNGRLNLDGLRSSGFVDYEEQN